jgi:hypothetical protein
LIFMHPFSERRPQGQRRQSDIIDVEVPGCSGIRTARGLRLWTEKISPGPAAQKLPPAAEPARSSHMVFPWALFTFVVLSVLTFGALFHWLGGFPP